MASWPILSVVTFLPLVGALFCLVVNGPKEAVDRNCRSAAMITSLVTFLISLVLWVRFDPTKAQSSPVYTGRVALGSVPGMSESYAGDHVFVTFTLSWTSNNKIHYQRQMSTVVSQYGLHNYYYH